MPTTDQSPPKIPPKRYAEEVSLPAARSEASAAKLDPPADDGTYALLKAGSWIVLVSLFSLFLTEKVFGGIGIYGAHSNAGWLSLMFALMGLPFGLMLLVLGIAKWLRNRSLRHPQL